MMKLLTYVICFISDGKFGAYMQVHIQNDGPVTIELESPTGPSDPKQLTKLEKQQQRKEKTRTKTPSEYTKEKILIFQCRTLSQLQVLRDFILGTLHWIMDPSRVPGILRLH
ncbi:hypothetical protein scyTo_0010286 [Scyliorhinus torazame]|uniref:D-aminoacyl-tRNA deacylase n=1 Tax=Scyliorhinus torazame TaxID=75743 RepID=A0A401P3J1_SCYTO|nr:hypothetical protein [Scyliorhinus torazame]